MQNRQLVEDAKRELLSEQLAETQAAIAAAEQAKQNYLQTQIASVRPIVLEFLTNQEVYDQNEANVGILTTFLVEHNIPATAESIQQVISQCGLSPKPALEGEELRQSVISQIMQLVKSSEGEKQRLLDSFKARFSMNREEIQSKKHSGPYCITTESLIQKLVNLKEDQRLRSLSHEELKAEVASKKRNFTYPPLPKSITAFQISGMSADTFKKACSLYGVDALNARIAEQKQSGDWKGLKTLNSIETGE